NRRCHLVDFFASAAIVTEESASFKLASVKPRKAWRCTSSGLCGSTGLWRCTGRRRGFFQKPSSIELLRSFFPGFTTPFLARCHRITGERRHLGELLLSVGCLVKSERCPEIIVGEIAVVDRDQSLLQIVCA